MCKKIILVSGYKRAGKDFVSEKINNLIKFSTVYSLASPLKDIMAITLNMSVEELDSFKNDSLWLYDASADFGINFRKMLQRFGTDAMKKHFGDGVWADAFLNKSFNESVIIISDWRFNIEYEKINATYENVITIRVNDDNIKNTDTHSSETEIENFDFDYIIDNTAKDESVMKQIEQVVEQIL